MEKKTLQNILNKKFCLTEWTQVLKSVFGATNIFVQPKKILLKSTDKATEAYELGNFTTTDDRIIGLYRVVLTPKVWLERNKVGLHELLRSVYKYDVDGAIIVFDQGDKWRLSFVSEIKTLNDEGNIVEHATEPKRYTYLLGKEEKVKTPVDRLNKLTGKKLSIEDIRDAFSVEALNNEFYQIVADHFYQLVGGTVKATGKKTTDYGEGILKLPVPKQDNEKIYQEFTVRLIGRAVFSWFLKVKKSDKGIPLLPEKLLSSEAVKNHQGYYHNILEKLFFQTLNTPIDKRIDNLPEGCELIPFLNGGLFEPDINDFYKLNKVTGLSEYLNTLKIPNEWFLSFFTELEKYNFTIDENSTVDIEVSIDPEMLGRIFENLLAEIDPDSGETARKATGSFYTPREIVDYMSIESLTQYLHNQTGINPERIRPIFKLTVQKPEFTQKEKEKILDALDKVKVLDPACGSGAFPMGVLHKIVTALQKLDPDAKWWKERQIARIENPVVKKALQEKLDTATVEYAQKIGIIQNSLYGVDIQPIAAEISKLRAFLTLVVDENIDEEKNNRGIEPLPNLEFKFVTANTLIKLPGNGNGLYDQNEDKIKELQKLRANYLQSYGEEKEAIKQEFLKTQKQIFQTELDVWKDKQNIDTTSRAYKLSTWNPFTHESAQWFTPEWMFGVKEFDVVIGNPPYLDYRKIQEKIKKENYKFCKAKERPNLFLFFIERSDEILTLGGVLTFINPSQFLSTDSGFKIRKHIILNRKINFIIDVSYIKVFISAATYTVIWQYSNIFKCNNYVKITNAKKIKDIYKTTFTFSQCKERANNNFFIPLSKNHILLKRIEANHKKLDDFVKIKWGTSSSGYGKKKINKEEYKKNTIESKKEYFPILQTADIKKYTIHWKGEYIPQKIYSTAIINEFYKTKIVIARVTKTIQAAIDYNNFFVGKASLITDSKIPLKFLLSFLNSKLIYFWYKTKFESTHMASGYIRFDIPYLKQIPILVTYKTAPFETLVDYIIFLKKPPLLEGWQAKPDGVFRKYKQLPYNPKLKERAKALRKQGILSEVLFWKAVKNKQFLGLDFHRQKIIGNYIVDFYCPAIDLVVEIDGSSHDTKAEYDAIRDEYLKNLGLNVIHFKDKRIKKEINSVLMELENYCKKLLNTPPFGHPSERGEGNTSTFGDSSEKREENTPPFEVFEDIIDAMVMELYFEEEFHEKDLYFIKYAERDFKPIENLENDNEKAEVINKAYQKLQQKDNEISNNLKLMDINLPDIVSIIKKV